MNRYTVVIHVLVIVLTGLFSINPLFASDKELQNVFLPFSNISYIKFSYIEIRQSVFFKNKQYSSGIITYKKPDIIIKEVLKPQYTKYEIINEELNISKIDKISNEIIKKQINIHNFAQIYQFVDLLKAILSGDITFIQTHYSFVLHKQDKQWIVDLYPIDIIDAENIEHRVIKKITIITNREQILTIKMSGFGNEWTELKIETILKQH